MSYPSDTSKQFSLLSTNIGSCKTPYMDPLPQKAMHSSEILESLSGILSASSIRGLAEGAMRLFRSQVKGNYYSVCLFPHSLTDSSNFSSIDIFHPEEGWLPSNAPLMKNFEKLKSQRAENSSHPSICAFTTNKKPAVYCRSKLLPDALWQRTTHYQLLDRDLGIRDMVSIFLVPEQGILMSLNCGRDTHFKPKDYSSLIPLEKILTSMIQRSDVVSNSLQNGKSQTYLLLQLSRREIEILHWVREGKRNKEIASILNVSSHTVRKHLEHIFEKLGVETRSAAVLMISPSNGLPKCFRGLERCPF